MNWNTQLEECKKYDFALEVIRIKDINATPYKISEVPKMLSNITEDIYPISFNQTEILITHDFDYNYNLIKNTLSDINILISRLKYNKDFTDIASFIAIE